MRRSASRRSRKHTQLLSDPKKRAAFDAGGFTAAVSALVVSGGARLYMENDPRHTNPQYEAGLDGLRESLLKMGALIETQIARAVEALVNRDSAQARETIARDLEVNRLDIETDEHCIRLLALYQPTAGDLRLITIGDSLEAFTRGDAALAEQVIARDDEADSLNIPDLPPTSGHYGRGSANDSRATPILFVSKYLERIADHSTNIAEMVVFIVKGRDIRHMDKQREINLDAAV